MVMLNGMRSRFMNGSTVRFNLIFLKFLNPGEAAQVVAWLLENPRYGTSSASLVKQQQ